ncbi:hypothetical protein BDF19DRAFT_455954 [Syncephalis fuscata]|nr:hypothetical protein BDF19DRAFT_455954 [Syncephalis fuscata]
MMMMMMNQNRLDHSTNMDPLNVMNERPEGSLIDIQQQPSINEEKQEMMNSIVDGKERLNHLVDDSQENKDKQQVVGEEQDEQQDEDEDEGDGDEEDGDEEDEQIVVDKHKKNIANVPERRGKVVAPCPQVESSTSTTTSTMSDTGKMSKKAKRRAAAAAAAAELAASRKKQQQQQEEEERKSKSSLTKSTKRSIVKSTEETTSNSVQDDVIQSNIDPSTVANTVFNTASISSVSDHESVQVNANFEAAISMFEALALSKSNMAPGLRSLAFPPPPPPTTSTSTSTPSTTISLPFPNDHHLLTSNEEISSAVLEAFYPLSQEQQLLHSNGHDPLVAAATATMLNNANHNIDESHRLGLDPTVINQLVRSAQRALSNSPHLFTAPSTALSPNDMPFSTAARDKLLETLGWTSAPELQQQQQHEQYGQYCSPPPSNASIHGPPRTARTVEELERELAKAREEEMVVKDQLDSVIKKNQREMIF